VPTAEKTAEETAAIERHPITPPTMRHMHGLFRNHGLTTDGAVHAYLGALLGREVTSRKDLTEAEARLAIEDLNQTAVVDNPGGHATLARALVAVQGELAPIPKTHTANVPMKSGGSYSYQYADLTDVTDAAMPLLVKNGIAFTCLPRLTASGGYELAGTLLHTSGDTKEGSLPLFGRQAQELGSSITYARRYLLGCMTGLVTDDDEDGAIAAAQRERAQQQPPPWNGPTTLQLIDRISQLAIDQGTDPETMTAKWRERHGGLPYEALGGLDPWNLQPFVTELEAYLAKKAAEQAAAEKNRQEQPA
jgi:hypothetical protein